MKARARQVGACSRWVSERVTPAEPLEGGSDRGGSNGALTPDITRENLTTTTSLTANAVTK